MYHISDFIPYDGKFVQDSQIVLVWSVQTGYYFTEAYKRGPAQIVAVKKGE